MAPGSVSIYLLCRFDGEIKYPIVYTHILLSIHFAIQCVIHDEVVALVYKNLVSVGNIAMAVFR